MTDKKDIKIKPAKGRPMLSWVGKRPLKSVTAFPAQHIETFDPAGEVKGKKDGDTWKDWPDAYPKGGLLFHGDNKEVLAHLLANGFRGKVNLIYIDPPFNTGVDYVRKVTPRGIQIEKIHGEGYSFTEQIQYAVNWQADIFLQFLYDRLQLAKEMLAADGMIFIRMDVHFAPHLRLIADEIFGTDNFQNDIIVNRIKKNVTEKGRRTIPHAVDHLLVYFKDINAEFRNVKKKLQEKKPGYWHAMESQGVSGPRQLIIEGKTYFPSPGTHLKFPQKQADEMYAQDRIRINPSTNKPEYWVEEKDYLHLDSNWTDIPGYTFTTGYPTENAEKLLHRVLEAGSKINDIVMDFFIGSGTTAAVAQKLGRRWIGCDINKGAIQTTSKRLQTIIKDQIKDSEKAKAKNAQGKLLETEEEEIDTKPSQLAFTVWRVNDYDLQIQHNEAVNLACEHIGIERTRSDRFFEGALNKKLAKIIPFNHPLSPLDLEEIKRELDARPDEDRNIIVVCLGKELSADSWLEDWNRVRKGRDAVNKIEIIELRTDPKFGKFISHKPATAKVSIKRIKDKIKVEVEDFISPTIIERLEMDTPVFKAKITDWRSMVDCIMIDTAYNGKVFNVTLSDVPERKTDLVNGSYALPAPLPAPKGEATVAVKIIDMLGEEVIETKQL